MQAEEISHKLFKIARDCNDDDIRLQAHHTAWPTGWVRGNLADAIAHIDAGMDLYDEVRHARHRFVYMCHDPAVCALSVGATVHWALGQPERGMRLERDARKLAQRLQHPPSLALGLSFVGEAQVARRDVAAAMATAQELLALCDEHHLPQPRATALMFFGWAWRTAAMSLRVYVTLRKGSVSGAGSALAFTSRVQYACWQRCISRADAMPTV